MSARGPFDRRFDPRGGEQRDRSAQVILIGMGILGLVLFILVVSPLSIFGDDDDDDGSLGDLAASSRDSPASGLPEGFTALSILFDDLEAPEGTTGPYELTMPLLETVTDGRNIGLYTLRDDRWERVSSATLLDNGTAAKGEVAEMPGNLAVLRLTSSVVQVSGWLPPGVQPDPDGLAAVTTLNPVDYAPAPDGGLLGTATELPTVDGNIVPTVRAASPEADEAVNAILASPALRDDHITALVQLALEPGNAGVDIDYPRVSPSRRADFTAFVTALTDQLHQANRTLSVTLPAPVRSGVSWETGAYDWAELSAGVDLLKLASESDPALFHARTTEVLDFLNGSVDLKKVALAVPRHSVERSPEGLRAMTLHEGLALAAEIEVRTAAQITPNSSVVIVGRNIFQDDGASGMRWDETANAVSFDYPGRGGTHTAWLENAISLGFKLDFVQRYGLGGVAITDVSDNPGLPDYWEPLRILGETGSVTPVQPNAVLLRPTWEVQAGTTQTENRGNLVWTAPSEPGIYEIQLIVSDGVIRASQLLPLEVQAPAP